MHQKAHKYKEQHQHRENTPISGDNFSRPLRCLLVTAANDLSAAEQAIRLQTYYRLTPGSVEVIPLQPVRVTNDSLLSPRRLTASIFRWSEWIASLVKKISDCNLVHLFVEKKKAVVTFLIPVLVLSRFFGRPLIVSLSANCNWTDSTHDRLGRWLLSMAAAITVGSMRMERELASRKCPSRFIPPAAFPDRLSCRLIESVQPSMLAVISTANYAGAIGAIRAFKLVKQKYPRAELTLAAEKQIVSDLAGIVKRAKLSGISLCEHTRGREISSLFVDKDMFLNLADTDSSTDSLIQAMLSGLPIVTLPTAVLDSLLEDGVNARFFVAGNYGNLADRIIELIESPELVSRLSAQARASAAGFKWPNVARHWNRLYLSFCNQGH